MNELSDLEFRIIDELYFVNSFDDLVHSLQEDRTVIEIVLIQLLHKGLIIQLIFEIDSHNYKVLDEPDLHAIRESFFVASKSGLLLHNSRS